ncbi:MAG: CHAP domain-containing protein [Clostridia bacterium]|nr:CHAP domain-containing protein [Clostridia bacterium]
MYFLDFMNKYNGKKVDFDRAYGAQCVDLFRFFNREVLEINQPKPVEGAKDFWSRYSYDVNLYSNFEKISNTLTFVPKEGDVAVWNMGKYGHIAMCTGVGDTKKFEAFGQNYPAGSACKKVTFNYSNFLGILRPKAQDKIKSKAHTFWVMVEKKAANVRKQPSLKAALSGSKVLYKGDKFEAVGIVNGDSVSGNNKWYHSKVGNYVWSGGLKTI